jgi:hypothetical protein
MKPLRKIPQMVVARPFATLAARRQLRFASPEKPLRPGAEELQKIINPICHKISPVLARASKKNLIAL